MVKELQNPLISRKNITNFIFLSAAEGIGNVFFLVSLIYLARVAGFVALGQVTFARAIIQYLLLFVNAGLELYAIREGSRHPSSIPNLINTFVSLRLILVLFGFGLLAAVLAFIPLHPGTKQILLLFGGMMLTTGLLLEWPFQAVEKMHFSAVGRIVAETVSLAAVIIFIRQSGNVYWVPLGRFAGTGLQLALLLLICLQMFGKIHLEWQPGKWKGILKESLPMAAGFMMVQVYSYTDNIMLGFFRSEEEVGFYSAAYKIVMAVVLIGVVYHRVVYPSLSRLFHESKEKMDGLLFHSIKLMVVVGIPLVVGFVLLAPDLIRLLYKQGSDPSILLFQILMFKVPLMWVNGLVANAVLASNQEKRYLLSVSIGAGTNFVLNLILIPLWGMKGAAIATILSECAVFFYFLVAYLSKMHVPVARDIRGIFVAAAIPGLFYLFLGTKIPQKFLLLFILCFVYFLILCIFKTLDFKRIVAVVRSR